MNCPGCGKPLPEGAPSASCPLCGTLLSPALPSPPPPPGPDSAPHPPEPAGVPWEDRQRLGFFSAILATLRSCLAEPADFFNAMPPREKLGDALGYAVILGWVSAAGATFWGFLLYGPQMELLKALGMETELDPTAQFLQKAAQVISLVAAPVFILLALFVGGAIFHLCLMMVGGARMGIEATLRVYAYSFGSVSLFQWIPICGGLVLLVWSLVLLIIGLSRVHKVGTGRAAVAVFLPLIGCCGLYLIVIGALFFYSGLAALSGSGGL